MALKVNSTKDILLKNDAELPIQGKETQESRLTATERDVDLWRLRILVEHYRAVR